FLFCGPKAASPGWCCSRVPRARTRARTCAAPTAHARGRGPGLAIHLRTATGKLPNHCKENWRNCPLGCLWTECYGARATDGEGSGAAVPKGGAPAEILPPSVAKWGRTAPEGRAVLRWLSTECGRTCGLGSS